jgi:hypothetical protein
LNTTIKELADGIGVKFYPGETGEAAYFEVSSLSNRLIVRAVSEAWAGKIPPDTIRVPLSDSLLTMLLLKFLPLRSEPSVDESLRRLDEVGRLVLEWQRRTGED